jgi:aminopeptidase N/puromycin-sensitive aminopeptidase
MDRLGFEPKPGESPETAELRPEVMEVLGAGAHDPRVIAEAHTLAEKYLQDPDSVDATLAPTVLQLAAENGDTSLYNQYLAAMPKMKTPEQFYALGRSINSFTDPELVKRTILYGTSDKVRNQDAAFIFAGALRDPDTRDTAWPIIKENWPAIQKTFTLSSGGAVVGAAGSFCDPQSRADVAQFFAQHPVPSAERRLKQTLEKIDSCIDLRNTQSENLQQWLSQNGQ